LNAVRAAAEFVVSWVRDSSMNYAGDIDVREAWALLQREKGAQLVDVRSAAEWTFVGVPDLRSLGKAAILAEWQSFPDMSRNSQFEAQVAARLREAGATESSPVLFLCRSGARSQAAANAMTAAGFNNCFNVSGGFEGDLDTGKHRGKSGGWKFAGLPWVQS
jgi:rhodanese-related sulfurtransferase